VTSKTIKIGTRGSKLALWQANWVKSALNAGNTSIAVELVPIKTKGDKIQDVPLAKVGGKGLFVKVQDVPLAKVGGKGLFVKEIEDALLNDRIDLAVHSMKDMPSEIPDGLCVGAIPEREIPQDVLISKKGLLLHDLMPGARIGTSSLRRPDLVILPLRGNIDTRLKKLETENLDAIILAAAGVKRLGLENRITEYMDENVMLPAVGQGALCIEIRQNDPEIEPIIAALNHQETWTVVMGERAFLNRLEGGCQVPIAAHGKIEKNTFTLCGLVAAVDGTTVIKETLSGPEDSSESIGVKLADRLLSMGAKTLMENLNPDFS